MQIWINIGIHMSYILTTDLDLVQCSHFTGLYTTHTVAHKVSSDESN